MANEDGVRTILDSIFGEPTRQAQSAFSSMPIFGSIFSSFGVPSDSGATSLDHGFMGVSRHSPLGSIGQMPRSGPPTYRLGGLVPPQAPTQSPAMPGPSPGPAPQPYGGWKLR